MRLPVRSWRRTAGAWSVAAVLCFGILSLGPTAAQSQETDAVLAAMAVAGGELGARAASYRDLVQFLSGAGEVWTEQVWGTFVQLVDRTGLAVDAVVPAVAGCIHDDQGRPVAGAWVEARYVSPGVPVVAHCALTNGPEGLSSFGVCPAPAIPVAPLFVSEGFRNRYRGGGCYWIPVNISWVRESLIGGRGVDRSWQALVTAWAPGYAMEPEVKLVAVSVSADGSSSFNEYNRTKADGDRWATSDETPVRTGQTE